MTYLKLHWLAILFCGTLLGGVLLLGTAGLVLGTDPVSSRAVSPPSGMSGGMMGGQMPGMTAMRAAMGADGSCDPALMQAMHDQYHSAR